MTDPNEIERIQNLVSSVARLPRSIEPPTDQWPEIRRRIDENRVIPIHNETSAPPRKLAQLRFSTPTAPRRYLVAAAAVIVTIGAVYLARRSSNPRTELPLAEAPSPQTTAPIQSPSVPPAQGERANQRNAHALPVSSREDANRVRVMRSFTAYEDAARELSWSLEARRSQLDPRTLAVIDTCLKEIDKAIREARAALGRNPSSEILGDFLQSSYQQKLDLLKRTVEGPRRTL